MDTTRIGFLLLDGFTMIAFANAIEPFRMANYVSGRNLYSWRLAGLNGNRTAASNGLYIEHTHLQETLTKCSLVFICGGYETGRFLSSSCRYLIERLAQQGVELAGICTGALAMADAGVLDGRRASIHWENKIAAQESYPAVQFNHQIYTLDNGRYTCSGGTAALDLSLQIIRASHGAQLAGEIAEQFLIDHWREAGSYQHLPKPERIRPGYQHVMDAVSLMHNHLEEPLSQEDICLLIGVSTRQLQRLFRQYNMHSPADYYLNLRLQRGRELLQQTFMSVTDIALACGFTSLASFSKAYKRHYQTTPLSTRQQQHA